tara:strand:+ start:175 stop:348 length:174 start_codon:yes stop_codon:yes gene_type:complete
MAPQQFALIQAYKERRILSIAVSVIDLIVVLNNRIEVEENRSLLGLGEFDLFAFLLS